ncbi:hypothetical protein NEUTE1DRAFT_116383, partial [Neurospora tetrasperma FGSC 2508]
MISRIERAWSVPVLSWFSHVVWGLGVGHCINNGRSLNFVYPYIRCFCMGFGELGKERKLESVAFSKDVRHTDDTSFC